VLYFVSCVNQNNLKSEGGTTSVSTICVALLFPVIHGMSRNYLNSVHLIAFIKDNCKAVLYLIHKQNIEIK